MNFRYITPTKKITGTGVYTISLDGQLTEETGDLNLYKIASNYLQNVPLQSGGVGDTGDMKIVEVEGGIEGEGDYFNFSWFPPTPSSYFPVEESKQLSINVVGDCNDVDTQKQGYGFQINPAYKPSIAITLTSTNENVKMSFGGIYDLNTNQDFSSDNVGITPLVKKGTTETELDFAIEFESIALSGDGNANCQ